jgi:PEP-CTERM motif
MTRKVNNWTVGDLGNVVSNSDNSDQPPLLVRVKKPPITNKLMKLKNTFLGALALVAACYTLPQASAEILPPSNGDLFIGFRINGGGDGANFNYVIDIGQASNFRDLNSGSLLIGNFGADLNNLFRDNTNNVEWYNRSDLYWSVIGYVDTTITTGGITDTHTIYAGKAENPVGTAQSPYPLKTAGASGTLGSNVNNAILGYQAGTESTSETGLYNSSVNASIESTTGTNPWKNYSTGANAFYGSGFEANSSTGLDQTALDLFRLPQNGFGTASNEVRFTIDDSGNITATAAVPEPSTWALISAGLMVVLFGFRRRFAAQG